MRRFFLTALAALLGVALVLPARQVAAYEPDQTDLQRRIAELEGMMAEVRQGQAVQASYMQPGPMDGSVEGSIDPNSGAPVYDYPSFPVSSGPGYPVESGFTAQAEFGFLKPFATNGSSPGFYSPQVTGAGAGTIALSNAAVASAGADATADINFQVAPRVTIGYKIPGGMGIRARYFQFDHTGNLANPATTANLSSRLRLETADVESYGVLRRGRNSGTMFGGIRYAQQSAASRFTNAAGTVNAAATQNTFGTGITGGITGASVIGQSGYFSLNSGVRGSVLFGNAQYQLTDGAGFAAPTATNASGIGGVSRQNNVFSIWEVSVGSQFRRPLPNGFMLTIGSSVEAQLWQGSGTLDPWAHLKDVGGLTFNGARNAASLGDFAMLGFWNSFGLSY